MDAGRCNKGPHVTADPEVERVAEQDLDTTFKGLLSADLSTS